jgi:hypothetical protein
LLAHFQSAVNRQSNSGTRTDPELTRLLVQAARQVALSAEEIRKLPDNYAPAVAPGA